MTNALKDINVPNTPTHTENDILKLKLKWAEKALEFGYEKGGEALAFKTGWYLAVEMMAQTINQAKDEERKRIYDALKNSLCMEDAVKVVEALTRRPLLEPKAPDGE